MDYIGSTSLTIGLELQKEKKTEESTQKKLKTSTTKEEPGKHNVPTFSSVQLPFQNKKQSAMVKAVLTQQNYKVK